jgi:hypothetical protein
VPQALLACCQAASIRLMSCRQTLCSRQISTSILAHGYPEGYRCAWRLHHALMWHLLVWRLLMWR